MGTVGHGLLTLDVATGRTRRLRHDPALATSLTDNNIEALYKDRAGLVWICSVRSMSTYDPSQRAFITVFGASSRQDSISESNVDSILPMPDGRIWLGLDTNGVDVIDPDGVRVAALRADPSRPVNALPKDYVNALAAARRRGLCGDRARPVSRGCGSARAVRVAMPDGTRAPRCGPCCAMSGCCGSAATACGRSIWRRAVAAAAHAEAASGLTDQRVTVIRAMAAVVSSGWARRTASIGIDLHTHAIEKFCPIRRRPRWGGLRHLVPDGFPGTALGGHLRRRCRRAEARDPSGRPRFRHIGLAQGLVNDNTDMLLEDTQHHVWVSTDDGIAQYRRARDWRSACCAVPKDCRLLNFWVGSGAQTPQGELLFGGLGGLTVVRPERLTRMEFPATAGHDGYPHRRQIGCRRRIGLDDSASSLTVPPHRQQLRGGIFRARLLRAGAQPICVPAGWLRCRVDRFGAIAAHRRLHQPASR